MTNAHRAAAVALMLALALAADAFARQRWQDLYIQAKEHVRLSQWKDAETKLLESTKLAKLGPNDRIRAIRRQANVFDDYMPEYYLGLVYFSMNRPKEAVTMFQAARKLRLDENKSEFRLISSYEQKASEQIRLADAGPGPGPTPPAPAPAATPTISSTDVKPITPANPDPAPPPVAPIPATPKVDVAALAARVDDGLRRRDPSIARRELSALAREAPGAPMLGELTTRVAQLERELQIEDALKRRDAPGARRQLNSLTKEAPGAPVLAGLGTRLLQLERELQGEGLQRDAVRSFYAGNYRQTLDSLAQAEKLVSRLTARGHFYRACSLAAQAAMASNDTTTEDPRIRQARQSYQLASRSAAEYKQDLQYISPKVRKLLNMR